MSKELPLVVIVGPTASGKTALAVNLAEEVGGEIICADSRTVYKGMDIGTAKPTLEDRARVPHWGLDLVEPDRMFSAADFKSYADGKIADIRARGKVPFLVGGSGLYVDAVIFDYQFGSRADDEQRLVLEALSLGELHEYCRKNNIDLPENISNKRYVIRSIERQGLSIKRRSSPIGISIIVGIATQRHVLRERIASRAEQLFANGVVEESIRLGKKYGWMHESMTGNIYSLARECSGGVYGIEEARAKFATADWQLAKRQLTWFRRNPYIMWLSREGVPDYLRAELADL